MKSRPILFSAPMVQAILAGRKTQTRRIVKLTDSGRVKAIGSSLNWHLDDPNAANANPYGQPGDQLWVKETWRTQYANESQKPIDITEGDPIRYEVDGHENGNPLYGWGRIRQSIFMRRWMSRITLELTGIRVERLQNISEADAWQEGVSPVGPMTGRMARDAFEFLWHSINGAESWDANPFVWVVEFKRIKP